MKRIHPINGEKKEKEERIKKDKRRARKIKF